MKLVFATTNPHKSREVREILAPFGVQVVGLDELEQAVPEPVEDAPTLEGNARLKAVAYALALGRPCLADDSGLEVDALGGAPGVHSARYAGVDGPRDVRDRANREKLVAAVRRAGASNSAVRLVCTLCLADAAGSVLFESRGTIEGVIQDEPRGGKGFGYDALLYLPEAGKMVAELEPHELNAISHRGKAVRALGDWLVLHPVIRGY